MTHGSSERVLLPAIYAGFFWDEETDDVLANPTLRVLREHEVQALTAMLEPHLNTLSTHGWYRGIPDRTLLLPTAELRLVYGKSMRDEFGVRSLDGTKTKGFFRSNQLLEVLGTYEHATSGQE